MRVNLQVSQNAKDRQQTDNDTLLAALRNKTPQQAADYVTQHVTDLAAAKQVLASLAKAITYILRNM